MKQKELDFFTKKTNWEIQKNLIYKKYKLKNFVLVKYFFNLIADESEKQNHHPKIIVSYNELEVYLTTHDVGRITEKDLHLASTINEIFNEIR
jgi:4a-hydroxytetrahydrobiopterin dehydratase